MKGFGIHGLTLHQNVPDRQRRQTREELPLAIIIWIEQTYHRRRQPRLGRSVPIEYQTIKKPAANLAA